MSITAEGVREWPILMSGPLVLASLKDLKTVTRRVPVARWKNLKVGDRLWVRERHRRIEVVRYPGESNLMFFDGSIRYANGRYVEAPADWEPTTHKGEALKWRPSIFMPRWGCRLVLEVTAHREERLQEITFRGIRREGKDCPTHDFAGGFCSSECPDLRQAFIDGWNQLNGERGYYYHSNPKVKVIEYKRVN